MKNKKRILDILNSFALELIILSGKIGLNKDKNISMKNSVDMIVGKYLNLLAAEDNENAKADNTQISGNNEDKN
jgi:hypothetical protein